MFSRATYICSHFVSDADIIYVLQVANFEYIDEVEAEEAAKRASMGSQPVASNVERATYWEELLKDKYEVHKIEEFKALGKGKRSRKQVSRNSDSITSLIYAVIIDAIHLNSATLLSCKATIFSLSSFLVVVYQLEKKLASTTSLK